MPPLPIAIPIAITQKHLVTRHIAGGTHRRLIDISDIGTYRYLPLQWNPQETIIRSSAKLVDPSHVNKAGYRCAKVQGASNDDRFFITKDGNAHMPGLIDYGSFWLVDPGGERVADNFRFTKNQILWHFRVRCPHMGGSVFVILSIFFVVWITLAK